MNAFPFDKNLGLIFRKFPMANRTEFFWNFLSCNEIVEREDVIVETLILRPFPAALTEIIYKLRLP